MKIAYLGIDLLISALETAHEAGHDILKIYTCPCDNRTEFNLEVTAFAQKHNIPYTTSRLTEEDLASLKREGCELLLCAGYYYRAPITDAFAMVNVHPAPLPSCRGSWPMPLILLGAHPCGGVTIHRMAKDFDTGDILMQAEFPINPETDTLVSYMETASQLTKEMLGAFLADTARYLSCATPQGEGRYLPLPSEEIYTIRSTMTTKEADRILRAFLGYECIYEKDGERHELIGGRAKQDKHPAEHPFPLVDGFITAIVTRKLA